MRSLRWPRPVVSAVLVVGFLLQATGCSGWVAVSQPAPRALAAGRWRDVRLMLADDLTLELAHARIAGDSVIGVLRSVRIGRSIADTAQYAGVARRFGVAALGDSVIAVPLASALRAERYADPLGPIPFFVLGGLVVVAVVGITKLGNFCGGIFCL